MIMFNKGETVIHISSGALIVNDIVSKDFGLGLMNYYYLTPKFPNKTNQSLEMYLPEDSAALYIRQPITKEQANNLVVAIPSMEKIWITDAKERKKKFEEIYYSGDVKGLCQLVKMLYVSEDFFAKPMSLTDKSFLSRIRSNIFEEFAVALDITPEEVEKYISIHLGQE